MKAPEPPNPEINHAAQVPRPPFRWGTRVALPLGILLAFALLFAGALARSLSPTVTVTAVPVVERPAVARETQASLTSTQGEVLVQAAGWIEPDPFTIHASTLTDGTVEEVLFLEGESVERGHPLVRLVDDDARLALQRAEAVFDAAEETWEANIESRRAAEVAVAARRETEAALNLAHAEREVEQARLQEAEAIYERRRELLETETISSEEYDTARTRVLAKAAQLRVVEARIEGFQAQLERMRAEETAAARQLELRTEERRRLELARVALDEARLRVERLTIRAPIAGRVMQRLVEPGSLVMAISENAAMARVAALYDPEKLQVRVDVPLADAAKVGVGQAARIVVEVLPDQTFEGTVTRITNLADIQKNTLEVKVAIANPSPLLKPEMLARVRFLSASRIADNEAAPATGLSVYAPAEALEEGAAWLVTDYDGEEGRAARRVVETTGHAEAGWVEIAEGLRPGDLLVLSSDARLTEGQRLRVRAEGNE